MMLMMMSPRKKANEWMKRGSQLDKNNERKKKKKNGARKIFMESRRQMKGGKTCYDHLIVL